MKKYKLITLLIPFLFFFQFNLLSQESEYTVTINNANKNKVILGSGSFIKAFLVNGLSFTQNDINESKSKREVFFLSDNSFT